MPSDAQRIKLLSGLIQEGYGDRLLVSHDIHTKHRLVSIYHFTFPLTVMIDLIVVLDQIRRTRIQPHPGKHCA